MNINSLALLDKTVQVTPEVMRVMAGLLERKMNRDDPEWAATMALLTVSENRSTDKTIKSPAQRN